MSLIPLILVIFSLASHLSASPVESDLFTGPSEKPRFSRILHDNAASLQFSSISNLSPPIAGLPKDFKESKVKNHKKASLSYTAISPTNFGRRTLDYDDSELFADNGEPIPRKIASKPQSYVTDVQSDQEEVAAASVASINRQPVNHRVPLTLLRQSRGKTVNVSPVFPDAFSGVQVPSFYQEMLNSRSDIAKEDTATTLQEQNDDEAEATTLSTSDDNEPKMVVNIVTSAPRIEVEKSQNETSSVSTVSTTPTTTTTVTTPKVRSTITTSTIKPLTSVSPDVKENLVVQQSARRIGTFADFEDTPTRLQTSESNTQPARVNVKPSASGKEYEYEYIYYYYDDDENNGTSTKNSSNPAVPAKSADFETEFDDDDTPVAAGPLTRGTTTTRPTTTTTTTLRTTTTTTTRATPIPQRISPADKFSKGVVNEIQGDRSPKVFQTEKASSPEVDYKIESGDFEPEYEYEEEEEEEVVDKAKGQPHRQPSEETQEDESPVAVMVKSHPSSVNTPIVLKQSTLLQSVPASRLNTQPELVQITTPTSTSTTTVESASEPVPSSVRPGGSRFRGSPRVRGETKPEEATEAPQPRPSLTRGRLPSRRPSVETSQNAPATETSSSQPTNVRSRFPSRSTTTVAPTTPTQTPVHTDTTTQDKEIYARNKAANDLFTFTKLQQAISSRAPTRKELHPVFQKQQTITSTSVEQNTEPNASSEATTFSAEPEVHEEVAPSSTTTTSTTTTTTTEKPAPADLKFGRQRNRFGSGRGRSTTPSGTAEANPSTEATPQTQTRGRFNRRRPTASTAVVEQKEEAPSNNGQVSDSERPKLPTRNRFSLRTRPTTEATTASANDENKGSESGSVSTPVPVQRRRPGFQGRRRQQAGTATEGQSDAVPSPSTQVSDASPTQETERRRPGLPNVQRRRPASIGGPRRGRLGVASSTTEKVAETPEQVVSEQKSTNENEHSETSATPQAAPAAPSEASPVRGATGVLGRLRTNSRPIVTTTTAAPVSGSANRPRGNGILGRRNKPGTLLAHSSSTAAPKKEESEVNEEPSNTAQEKDVSKHKGVVVQVSSSITESEEVHHGEEEASEPSSTTAGSILNRLKSQRKPGSIFRRRTDPHGE